MKNRVLAFLMFAMFVSMATFTGCTANATGNSSTEFWVRSNCEMCKETIETALKGTEGVANAELNLDKHMVKIDFDSTKTNVDALHKACAGAGYETKVVSAIPTAYDNLPKCCKKVEDM